MEKLRETICLYTHVVDEQGEICLAAEIPVSVTGDKPGRADKASFIHH